MGGIISKYRLCVYFKKFSDEEIHFVKQFILFNTNKYFIRNLSIAIRANGKTLYLPAQKELATAPENNSIGLKYKDKFFLFPTNTTIYNLTCNVRVHCYVISSDRTGTKVALQMSVGGNTVGLNYKIKWEVIEHDWMVVGDDFERSVSETWETIIFSYYTALAPDPVNKIKLTCEGSDEPAYFVLDYGNLPFDDKFTFNLVES